MERLVIKLQQLLNMVNTNLEAKKYMSKEYLNNKAVFIPDEELKKSEHFKDVGDATKTYDLIWSEFKQQ